MAMNFLIVQIYGSFSDIVLFCVLEMKSLSFESTWSCVSFTLSLFFIAVGLCILALHFKFLVRYKRLKPQISTRDSQVFENFIKKHSHFKSLYQDFSDSSLFKHGFLLSLIFRGAIISLIVEYDALIPFTSSHTPKLL